MKGEYENMRGSYSSMTTIQLVRNQAFKLKKKKSWPFDYCNYVKLAVTQFSRGSPIG